MHDNPRIRQDDKASSRLASEGADGRFDLCVAMNGRYNWRDLEWPRFADLVFDKKIGRKLPANNDLLVAVSGA
jgi:hypothetical protein